MCCGCAGGAGSGYMYVGGSGGGSGVYRVGLSTWCYNVVGLQWPYSGSIVAL